MAVGRARCRQIVASRPTGPKPSGREGNRTLDPAMQAGAMRADRRAAMRRGRP
jgi:hypothetical protein